MEKKRGKLAPENVRCMIKPEIVLFFYQVQNMIAHLAAGLLILGLVAEIFQNNRMQRSWAFLLWLCFGAVVLICWQGKTTGGALYLDWINSPLIRAGISLKASSAAEAVLRALLPVAFFSLYYNIFYNAEKKRLRPGGLFLLITGVMSVLAASENLLQLLVCVYIVDILCFFLIREIEVKQKFVFFNLLADTALTAAFAIIWGTTGQLGLSALSHFSPTSGGNVLVPVFVAGAAASKAGLFLFHNNLLDLKKICFVRASFIMMAATPLSGALIFYKMHAVMENSGWVLPVLEILAALTILWAAFGAMAIDNIHAKTLYLNMLVYGMLFGILCENKNLFLQVLPTAAGSGILTTVLLMLPVVAASNEILASAMGRFGTVIKTTMILSLLAVLLQIPAWTDLSGGLSEKIWINVFLFIQLSVLAHIFGQIYLGASNADEKVWAMLKNPHMFYFLGLLILAGFLEGGNNFLTLRTLAAGGFFLLFFVSRPLRRMDRIYENKTVQETEPLMNLYNMLFVVPLTVMGRILWLLVDFLLIEKTFVNALSRFVGAVVRLSVRAHANPRIGGIVFTLLGGLVVIACLKLAGGR